jgi:hypothetical protein
VVTYNVVAQDRLRNTSQESRRTSACDDRTREAEAAGDLCDPQILDRLRSCAALANNLQLPIWKGTQVHWFRYG